MKSTSRFCWTLIALVFAISGICAFFIFYHPPMRLMPPPLLVLSDKGEDLHTRAALVSGDGANLFYATNRYPVWTNENRIYTVAPDKSLHVGLARLGIDIDGSSIDQLMGWTMEGGGSDRPYVRLLKMTEYGSLNRASDGVEKWWEKLISALDRTKKRSVIIYVHGANTTVERAAGQASQVSHFSGDHAVVVLFAWPTAENFLKYPRDIQNALDSAPGLAELIRAIRDRTSVKRINMFSYSAGATVASQTLSLIAQNDPDLLAGIGEVYFAAPDVDFTDFVDDLGRYVGDVHRVTAAVNLGDSALRLAKVVNRASRAGRPDIAELSPEASATLLNATGDQGLEVVHVDPDVLPGSTSTSHTFWYDDPWVSSDILGALLFQLSPVERGLVSRITETGNQFWHFPEDYPDHISKLQVTLIEMLK